MPRLDMHIGAAEALAFNVNGKEVKKYFSPGTFVEDKFTYEGMPLEKGWNHVLIKVVSGTGDWKCKVHFTSNTPDFLKEIETIVER